METTIKIQRHCLTQSDKSELSSLIDVFVRNKVDGRCYIVCPENVLMFTGTSVFPPHGKCIVQLSYRLNALFLDLINLVICKGHLPNVLNLLAVFVIQQEMEVCIQHTRKLVFLFPEYKFKFNRMMTATSNTNSVKSVSYILLTRFN